MWFDYAVIERSRSVCLRHAIANVEKSRFTNREMREMKEM
jgi:hypothetical protein